MNTTELLKHPPMQLTEDVRKYLNDRYMFRPIKEVKEMIKVCIDNDMSTATEIIHYDYSIITTKQGFSRQYANKIFKTVEKFFKNRDYDNAKS